jgi:hypothetical protein
VKSRGTPEFWRLYRTLPPEIQRATHKAYAIFLKNPAHPALHLERLRSDPRVWSVRITRDYRAVAVRSGDDYFAGESVDRDVDPVTLFAFHNETLEVRFSRRISSALRYQIKDREEYADDLPLQP